MPTAPVARKCQNFATNAPEFNSKRMDSALMQFSDQKSNKTHQIPNFTGFSAVSAVAERHKTANRYAASNDFNSKLDAR